MSNAVTSGCFGDQTFSKSLVNDAGESSAQPSALSGGTRQSHFEAQYDFASTQVTQQVGQFVSVSADRGDGARMSYVGFDDQIDGIHVNFVDYQDAAPFGTLPSPANGCAAEDDFIQSDIATINRTSPHTIKTTIDFVDGPRNDVVKVYVDGVLKKVGTTWEDYFRWCTESGGGVPNDASADVSRAVDSLLFRTGGTAFPGNAGNGYVFDNLNLTSNTPTPPTATTILVQPANMATSTSDVIANPTKWFFYNDETDVIDNSLGSFVTGPSTPPLGTGSVQISVTGTQRRNLATYQFAGTKLEDITTLKYSTYNPSAGNGGSSNRSAYLNINVDFNGSNTFQRRIAFVPNQNGTVTQNNWKEWDAYQGGNSKWSYSGPTWPGTVIPGTTLRTWNDLITSYPNIRILPSNGWLGMRVGEPYADGYTENLDKFVLGTAATVKTFNFDPAPVPGTLQVVKSALGGNGTFNFSSPQVGTFSITTSGGTGSKTFTNLPPGTYAVTETGATPSNTSGGEAMNGWAMTSNGCASVTVVSGATTTCTVVNKRYGEIIVTKWTTGGDSTFNFTSSGTGGGVGSFSMTTSDSVAVKSIVNVLPGTYTITEIVPPGWTLTYTNCNSVTVNPGQTKTCNFTNSSNQSNNW
jgi:hypothetical protein